MSHFVRRALSTAAQPARINIGSATAAGAGSVVQVAGWLGGRPKRIGTSLVFGSLRDWTGTVQLVATDEAASAALLDASPESVVRVVGTLRAKHGAGNSLELNVDKFELLNKADALPFDTHQKALAPGSATRPNDETLLKYRYIELRQPWLASNLQTRSKTAFTIRSLLNDEGFIEVETPCLFKSTPEGAREFLVPTRTKGMFFALPQSPQQFKQVLMAGGVEKYFQFARCFRDEAVGADRQQEFTQVDLEMSFVKQRDIMGLIERMICKVWKDIMHTEISSPFRVITYNEAMSRYGSDKPDTRYGLEVQNVSAFFEANPSAADASRNMFEAIVVPNGSKLLNSKKVASILNTIQQESFPYYGGSVSPRDLVARNVKSENLTSWANGFASDFTISPAFYSHINAQPGDLVFLNQRKPGYLGGHTIMGRTRLITAKTMVESNVLVIPPDQWNFLWVVDFPLFTPVAEPASGPGAAVLEATHHPFTAPMEEDAHHLRTNPQLCRAQHYDIVLNGCEIGGGSIRAHNPDTQRYILSQILKLSDEKIQTDFGHLLDALRFGCPPHGGIALGFDRFVSILCGASSIRDVIAFPKLKGGDLFAGSPTLVGEKALETYHIKVKE
ncbi:hypothetical protein BCR33DRAFT_713951 [Rhizoclosmatium globosum]|uniref:Aminoacyl-transfer RNA synthetases class-II family profile domain-containing protein n=1 Tax=Rhizoclosmatium globosum TaxID=329046 RepID=A0A1Y2CRK5_9FUNG|nr:hypothetical protein BCR33DRAFT_713951 [Rhizoclosmatium globosum]|eukprot:ORY49632.1 hypothetical protein BCR33DRAFT_713951 [Rhizoclosmatium globosum]